MFFQVAVAEMLHCRRTPFGGAIGHHIDAAADRLSERHGFGPGRLDRPFGIGADRVAPLAAADAAVEDEGFGAGLGHPEAEPADLRIEIDPVPRGGRAQ